MVIKKKKLISLNFPQNFDNCLIIYYYNYKELNMRGEKMKKISLFFVIVFVITSLSTVAIAEESMEMNLQTAVNMAIECNLDLKIEDLNLEKANIDYQKNKANNLLTQSKYNELQADYQLATAQNTYQEVYDNLVKSIIQQYTNIKISEQDLLIKEKDVELERLLSEKSKAQHEIGDISSIDLLEQENSYRDAVFNYETASDDYQQMLKEFKSALGLNNTKLDLEYFDKITIWEITEKETLEKALETSIELQLKEKEVELASIDLKRANVSASKLDKNNKELALEKVKLEKMNSEEEIRNETQEIYYNFKQAIKKMKLKKERLIESKEKYNIRQKQYEAGLITSSDVLQYELNMMQAKYQYMAAIADYYLQEHSLKERLNLKTGVFVNDSNE